MIDLATAVALVVLTSALCSLFEAVLYSVPLGHIETLAQKGKTGKVLRRLRNEVNQPITAILSLNTIANTAGAAVAGAIAASVLGTKWVWLFSALFTALILLISEIVPKTLGVVYARPLAAYITWPLQMLVWLFKPMVWLSGLITKALVGKHVGEVISENDLIMMAKVGLQNGVLDKNEASVIQNILSLEGKTVAEVMTPRSVLFCLDASISVEEAQKDKGILSHSRIPVYVNMPDEIVSVVHRHDILTCVAEDRFEVKLEELAKPVDFILETTTLDDTLKQFLDRREQIFVVIQELGGIAGVITLEDVLEEILGKEIVDEFDPIDDMRELAQKRRDQALKQGIINSG